MHIVRVLKKTMVFNFSALYVDTGIRMSLRFMSHFLAQGVRNGEIGTVYHTRNAGLRALCSSSILNGAKVELDRDGPNLIGRHDLVVILHVENQYHQYHQDHRSPSRGS